VRAVIDFLKGVYFLWDAFLCGSPEPKLTPYPKESTDG
jgi:hypothetical protein